MHGELFHVLASGSSFAGGLSVLLLFLAAAVIVAVAVSMGTPESEATLAFRRVATRVGGKAVGDSLQCEIGGRRAVLAIEGRRPESTRLEIDVWGRSPGSLSIRRAGVTRSLLRLLGEQDLRTGDLEFDRAFVVQASSESLASRLFSPTQRGRVFAAMDRLGRRPLHSVELNAYALTIRVMSCLEDDVSLMRLIEMAQEFSRLLLGEPIVAGLQIGELRILPGGSCPVCGDVLREPLVRCDRCGSPFHADCWRYVGRCSTYACGGRRSVA